MAECPQQPPAEKAAAAGQAAPYRAGAHLRGEVQLSSIHSSGYPVHPLCLVCLAVSKASFLVELTVPFIVYAGCISCSGIV